jgi:hypothetical protein
MSNHVFGDLNALLRSVRSLADKYAQGALSRPEMLVNSAIAAREGACATEDAEAIWNAFHERTTKRVADVGAVGNNEGFGSDKAHTVRCSEVRTVIAAAIKHNDLPETLNDARAIVTTLKGEGRYKGNMQDAFVAIARAAKKSDTTLTEDEIVDAVCPAQQPKDRTEKKELEKQLKQLKVLRDGTKGKPEEGVPPKEPMVSDELLAMIDLCEQRLAQLAG